MKKIIYLTLSTLLISGILCARDTKTFGSVIEFSYDKARTPDAELEAFDQEINDNNVKLIVVDFYSPSCGPCKRLGPCLTELAKEFPSVKFIKVNITTYQKIANLYRIRSVPQLFFFKSGSNKETLIGAKDKTSLQKTINKWLA